VKPVGGRGRQFLEVSVGAAAGGGEETGFAGPAATRELVGPSAALGDVVEVERAVFAEHALGELAENGRGAVGDAVERGEFADRCAGPEQGARGALDFLLRIEREEEFFAREHELDDRVGALLKDLLVVGDEREVEGVERGDVLHRAGDVGRVGAALQLLNEPTVVAHPVVDHVVEGLVERSDGVAAVVAETVEPAGERLVGHGDVAGAGEEADLKREGLAGRAFRFGAAEHRGRRPSVAPRRRGCAGRRRSGCCRTAAAARRAVRRHRPRRRG
jgi:hypothetical protein